MLQSMDQDLPLMSTEMLKLRSEVWEAEGLHLIYNVPRPGTGVERTGPLSPFPGLCIAFLMYLPKENTKFCLQVGSGDKAYVVGWTPDKSRGMYSLTRSNNQWIGRTDASKKTFPKGYVYVYFYFEKTDTMHAWINDTYDLQASGTSPYPVSDVGNKITLGCPTFNEASSLEIHWVIWGSSHNRNGRPPSSKVDQLFPRAPDLAVSFQDYDIFEMQAGTIVTIRTMYFKGSDPNKTDMAILIGCSTCSQKNALGYSFGPYNKPEEVYMFRVTITEKGAIIHFKHGVVYHDLEYCDGTNAKCRAYLTFECVKPLHIQVETMGQTWK